jgi:hypothetical protein
VRRSAQQVDELLDPDFRQMYRIVLWLGEVVCGRGGVSWCRSGYPQSMGGSGPATQ